MSACCWPERSHPPNRMVAQKKARQKGGLEKNRAGNNSKRLSLVLRMLTQPGGVGAIVGLLIQAAKACVGDAELKG
jgi:hypothetical protein